MKFNLQGDGFSCMLAISVTAKKWKPIIDAETDQRVYALHGLTDEEIKIVEGGS